MTTISGGTVVKSGYYLSKSNWEIFPVEHDGERLPGASAEHYVKLPLAAVFFLMPVLGGLMVVFLPFIGLALTARAAFRPVARMFRRSAEDLAATVTPGWQPGEAHFTGKRPEAGAAESKEPASSTPEIESLQKEIESKRS
jgi:hypothetical protein